MYSKELSIFSVFHKDYPQPGGNFICPIQVGKSINTVDLGMLSDNTGVNISFKNGTYCELTALFWIWKNIDDIQSEFIGLSHYRRYFCLPETKVKNFGWIKFSKENKHAIFTKQLNVDELSKLGGEMMSSRLLRPLKEGKLIVPRPISTTHGKQYPFSIKDNYIFHHIKEDWDILEVCIAELYPDYSDFASTFFSDSREMYSFNMFVGHRNFLISYCEWLFPLLEAIERKVKISSYPYQQRIFGFMAERLFNLYLKKNEVQTVRFPVVFFE